MLSKEKEIVAYLLKQSKPASVTQIAISCSVSDRTVYNVLSSLQNNPDFVLDMTDGGISLKENAPAKKDVIPSNYEERKQFIFRKALFGQPKVSVAEALNYLAISEATFHSDIIKMRKEIAPYHVKIQIKGDNLFFSGNYHDLKNLMQHVVYDEADQEHSLLSIQNLSVLFPSFDLELLKKCITSELKLRNVYMDEYSLMNLFLHILIYMSQQRPEQDNVQNQNKEVSGLIDGVCKRIEQDFGVQFTNAAKHQFSLMTQTRTKHNENQIQNNDPKDPRTEELVSLIYSKLLDMYNCREAHYFVQSRANYFADDFGRNAHYFVQSQIILPTSCTLFCTLAAMVI
jgi:lichenan operon transcriptional antiterminator